MRFFVLAVLVAGVSLWCVSGVAWSEEPPGAGLAEAEAQAKALNEKVEAAKKELAALNEALDLTNKRLAALDQKPFEMAGKMLQGDWRLFNTLLAMLSLAVGAIGGVTFLGLRGALRRQLDSKAKVLRAEDDQLRARAHMTMLERLSFSWWQRYSKQDVSSDDYKRDLLVALHTAEQAYQLWNESELPDDLAECNDEDTVVAICEAANSYAYHLCRGQEASDHHPQLALSEELKPRVRELARVAYDECVRQEKLRAGKRMHEVVSGGRNYRETFARCEDRLGGNRTRAREIAAELVSDTSAPAEWREKVARDFGLDWPTSPEILVADAKLSLDWRSALAEKHAIDPPSDEGSDSPVPSSDDGASQAAVETAIDSSVGVPEARESTQGRGPADESS